MPFTPSQQRYDALKKYQSRIQSGIRVLVDDVAAAIETGSYASLEEPSAPQYMLRPMGLLANGLLASENTGTTNELFLARYFVNEVYLHVLDIRSAKSASEAKKYHAELKKAIDSYLTLMNRVITPKVGDPFAYVTI